MEFLEALEIIFDVQKKHGYNSAAHSRIAKMLTETVADGLMGVECAKELMRKIGNEITISNAYYYNRGYNIGFDDAEEIFNDDEEQ